MCNYKALFSGYALRPPEGRVLEPDRLLGWYRLGCLCQRIHLVLWYCHFLNSTSSSSGVWVSVPLGVSKTRTRASERKSCTCPASSSVPLPRDIVSFSSKV